MPRRRYSSYNDFYYTPSRPIETEEGIKARNKTGMSRNWWATRWILALERLMDPGRLTRGRSYARRGQVLSVDETARGIEARVQGSRPQPYKVTIQLKVLRDEQWNVLFDTLSEQAIFAAQLLTGEMPQNIEEIFHSAGVSLFPGQANDLITHCSCPDSANPCKHIAATHYILGDRFDEDPFLIFRLRGRNQEEILNALRQRRAGLEVEETVEEEEPELVFPLEESIQNFWKAGQLLDEFSITIQPAEIEMPILKRLGDASFIDSPGILPLLKPAYAAIEKAALELARGDEGQENMASGK